MESQLRPEHDRHGYIYAAILQWSLGWIGVLDELRNGQYDDVSGHDSDYRLVW